MRKRVILTVLAAVLVISGCAGKPDGAFQAGSWMGGRYFYENGDFDFCGMEAATTSGHSLMYAIRNDGNLVISLLHNDWRLAPGTVYPTTVTVNGMLLGQFNAQAQYTNLFSMELHYSASVRNSLFNGAQLGVQNSIIFCDFGLAGFGMALSRLEDCVQRAG